MSPNPQPLTPDQVDELLSAELDGEFDAAAADFGLTVAEARALLAAAPGVTERREALGTARDALAAVSTVDEVTGARLRTAALDAFRETRDEPTPRRSHRWLIAASGGIAAALIGGFALAATTQSSHTKSTESASRVAASAPAPSHVQPVPGIGSGGIAYSNNAHTAIGSFSNSHDLARSAISTYATTKQFDAAAAATQPVKRSDSSSSTISLSTDEAAATPSAATPPCATPRGTVAPSDKLVAASNAILAGKPVVARVYAHGSQFVVVVMRPDCSVVATEHVS